MRPIKILVAIPNMGYTHVEAYGNRLDNFMRLGELQTERAMVYKFGDVLNEIAPEVRDKVLSKYLDKYGYYIKNIGEDIFEFWFLNIGRIFTPAAREEAAKKAIEKEMDFIFFVDDDMICPNDLFLKLYRHHFIADIVCPLAFTRNEPHHPVIYACREGYDSVNRSDYFINEIVMKYPKDKLVEVDASGFGAALIKVESMKRIEPPYFMCSSGTGEDILHCYKMKKAGGRVFVDTSVKIGHLGHPKVITEEYVEEYRKNTDKHYVTRYPEFSKYNALTLLGE